jgi:hypothetical protein
LKAIAMKSYAKALGPTRRNTFLIETGFFQRITPYGR